jgi:signal transduction histidine kinase
MDFNTCFATTEYYHTIAYYSHLVPVFIAALLGIFVLFASRFTLLSKIFGLFTFSFCLWLLGDVIIWVGKNYHMINFMWAPLDFINIIFYLLGGYFFIVLIRGDEKVPNWLKLIFFALTIPAWWITVTGQSISSFNLPVCEAFNNDWLTNYKLAIEWLMSAFVILTAFEANRKVEKTKKKQNILVALALLLFFAVFSVTEYIASLTGYYEMNLYSLFVLPVFLAMIIYSTTNLKMFHLRLLGTQLLVYVLLIMVGSQFFFLENATNQILTIITFILSIFFGIVLLRNVKRELEARLKIEKLAGELQRANDRLKELDKQKTEFVSFATHQLRSPLTAIRGNASLILEGDLGPVPQPVKEAVETIATSIKTQIAVVEDYLNISRLELGTMRFDPKKFDFKDMLMDVINEQKPNMAGRGLLYTVDFDPKETYMINADPDKFKQVIMNTIDNSIKYTPQGSISTILTKDSAKGTIRLEIRDTGVGIRPDVMPKLFQKFSRAPNASESNIHGTGLGLFIAKEIITAHKGRVWAESEGDGKGSQFYIEIPEAK